MVEFIILISIGLFSGIVSGMTGASGVMILIPLLTSFFGFSLVTAIGTSLMADIMASGPIAYIYHRARNVNVEALLILGGGAIIGTQIGARNVVLVPEGIVIIGVSIAMVALGMRMLSGSVRSVNERPAWTLFLVRFSGWRKNIIIACAGIVLGVMTGFFGAGGGILVFLILYFVFNYSLKMSIGTAAAVMLVSAFSGAFRYFQLGNIDVRTGLIVGASAAAGGILSSYLAHRINEDTLSYYVGILFILLACVMLVVRFIGI